MVSFRAFFAQREKRKYEQHANDAQQMEKQQRIRFGAKVRQIHDSILDTVRDGEHSN